MVEIELTDEEYDVLMTCMVYAKGACWGDGVEDPFNDKVEDLTFKLDDVEPKEGDNDGE